MKKSIQTFLLFIICVAVLSGCGEVKTYITPIDSQTETSSPTDSDTLWPSLAQTGADSPDYAEQQTSIETSASEGAESESKNQSSASNTEGTIQASASAEQPSGSDSDSGSQAALQPEVKEPSNNYLIILDNKSLVDAITEFVEFKTSEGYNVTSVVVDEILSGKAPAAEEIRDFLFKKEREEDIEFVLLIGDPFDAKKANKDDTGGKIPMKYFYYTGYCHTSLFISDTFVFEDGECITNGSVPTDLYYYTDFEWDKDRDGYYGESNNDFTISEMDKLKYLYKLGRIPFSDSKTVASILRHSVNTEREYANRTQEQKVLIAAGIIDFVPKLNDGAFWTELMKAKLVDYNVTTMYERQGHMPSAYESALPLTRESFSAEWNKGYDIVFTEAHSGCQRFVWDVDRNNNDIPDDDWPDLFFDDFFVMKDIKKNKTTFLVMSGCSTGRVEKDRYKTEFAQVPLLLADNMIVAGVGTTKSIGYYADRKECSILSVWENSGDTYGEVFQNAIVNYFKSFDTEENLQYCLTLYSYCYFGDPSLSLR